MAKEGDLGGGETLKLSWRPSNTLIPTLNPSPCSRTAHETAIPADQEEGLGNERRGTRAPAKLPPWKGGGIKISRMMEILEKFTQVSLKVGLSFP